MAWFRKDRKRRKAQRERLEIPPDAWDKCERCGHVDLTENFDRALQVCPECEYHRRIGARRYVEIMTDDDSFVELFLELRSVDPLEFEGYTDRVVRAEKQIGPQDAIVTGYGTLNGIDLNLGAMEFAFMGGSMGSVVGEKISRLATRSVDERVPLVLISASGGARMQEGVLSLMRTFPS
jgi:acetyl-CoA carboxylase carboxyl transferase subunit beta